MEDVINMCRLCQKNTSIGGDNLFENNNGIKYVDQVLDMLSIELQDTPEWPSHGCSRCINFLIKMKDFKKVSSKNKEYCETTKDDDETCSLCLNTTNDMVILCLMDTHQDVISADVVMDILDVVVEDFLDWPRFACVDCIDFLEELIRFQKRVLAGHNALYSKFFKASQENGSCDSKCGISGVIQTEVVVPERDPFILCQDNSIEEELLEDPEEINPSYELIEGNSRSDASTKETDLPAVKGKMVRPRVFKPMPRGPQPNPFNRPARWTRFSTYAPKVPIIKEPQTFNSVVRHFDNATPEELKLEEMMIEMKLFACRECYLYCKTLWALKTHVRHKHNYKEYHICCDLSITVDYLRLYDHFRLHLDKDAFKCKECGRQYKDRRYLKLHMISHHSEEPPAHICNICGKGFWANAKFEEHMVTHNKVKCEYCGKEYSSKYMLMSHVKMEHEVEVNCLCHICGRGFPNNHRLSVHIGDHGGPHGGNRKKKSIVKMTAPAEFNDNYFQTESK